MNLKKPGLNFLSEEEKGWGVKFSPFINERNILVFTKEFEKCINHISMYGNPKMIFFDTALTIVKLIKA